MKEDKFQYTARIVFECPCCAHQWRGEQKEYCPYCEVKIEYAQSKLPTEGKIVERLKAERDYEEYGNGEKRYYINAGDDDLAEIARTLSKDK